MRALVIGGDSGIGTALASALASRGDIVCSTTRRVVSAKRHATHLDLTSPDVDSVRLPEADVAFFCAAVTGFSACRTNEPLARQVNVTAPTVLARRLVAVGTRVVLLSTSAIFDWLSPHVQASCPPSPITVYGKLKAEAETAFSAFGSAAFVLRLTKVLTPGDSLFNKWIDDLNQKREVIAFSDHHMPVTLNDVVSALLAISKSSESGVFQISGARDVNYYEAALHLASRSQKREVIAFSDHHMAPVTLNDVVSALLAISKSSESGVFQISGARDVNYYEAALHLASRLDLERQPSCPRLARANGACLKK